MAFLSNAHPLNQPPPQIVNFPKIVVVPIVKQMNIASAVAYFNKFGEIEQCDLQRSQNCDFLIVKFKNVVAVRTVLSKLYHRIEKFIVPVRQLDEKTSIMMNVREKPMHLLSFNEQLLTKIIGYLSIVDLCGTAGTCTQLKRLSEQVFLSKFDTITMRARDLDASKVLLTFGHLITALDVDLIEPQNMFLNFIADNCGNNLRSLSLWMNSNERPCLDYNTRVKTLTMFSHLQELEIFCKKFFNAATVTELFTSCLSLESLSINCSSKSTTVWNEINVHFPQVKELKFQLNLAIDDRGLEKWLVNCSNTKKLYVDECPSLTSNAINVIVHYLPGLEELTIGMLQTCHLANLKQLAQLKYLKSVRILLGTALPVMRIIRQARIPIRCLDLYYVEIKNAHIEEISAMDSITELTIFSYSTSNAHLERIADNLPWLSKLTLAYSTGITIHGLEQLLKSRAVARACL